MIYNAPVKDMLFLIDEWIGLDNIAALEGFEHVDRELLEFILTEAGKTLLANFLTLTGTFMKRPTHA